LEAKIVPENEKNETVISLLWNKGPAAPRAMGVIGDLVPFALPD